MRLERQEEKVAIKVKTFFAEEPNYVFEKVAGTGAFGVTLCFRNEHAEPNGHRTIAVKAATWSNQDIGTEIKSLEVTTHFPYAELKNLILTTCSR